MKYTVDERNKILTLHEGVEYKELIMFLTNHVEFAGWIIQLGPQVIRHCYPINKESVTIDPFYSNC